MEQKKKLRENKYKIAIAIFLVFLASASFYFNIFESGEQSFFSNFQMDSDNLITGRIVADKFGIERSSSGYGRFDGGQYTGWKSLWGLQGRLLSILYNQLHIQSIELLRLLLSVMFAATMVVLCSLLARKYGALFGAIFYGCTVLSPWMVAMARNLFWVECTMFIPAICILLLLESVYRRSRSWWLYLVPLYLAATARFLCGYEYTSAILLFSISPLLADWAYSLCTKESHWGIGTRKLFWTLVSASAVLLAGFVTALVLHATIKVSGDRNVLHGLVAIWKEDVLRSTLGGAADGYDGYFWQLIATPWETLTKYIYLWSTPVLYGLRSVSFGLLTALSFATLVVRAAKRGKIARLDILYGIYFLAAVSWFVLGKTHAHGHTQIDYIVWYFGFVQITVFTLVRSIGELLGKCVDFRQIGTALSRYRVALLSGGFAIVLLLCACSVQFAKHLETRNIEKYVRENGTVVFSQGDDSVLVSPMMLLFNSEKDSAVLKNASYTVRITPVDRESLGLKRRQYGFDSFDFSQDENLLTPYIGMPTDVDYLFLPDYAIDQIWIQKEVNGNLAWETTILFPN